MKRVARMPGAPAEATGLFAVATKTFSKFITFETMKLMYYTDSLSTGNLLCVLTFTYLFIFNIRERRQYKHSTNIRLQDNQAE